MPIASALEPKTHLNQVDYIRAIAAMVVALFHLGGKTLPVLKYGWLGVQMFFLLSGFIICWAIPNGYNIKSAGRFIVKRIIRIEPPYLISIVLALIVHFIWSKNYQVDWGNVLTHLAYLNNLNGKPYLSPVYWTLGIEFQYYLFVACCYNIIRGKFGIYVIVALCASTLFLHLPGATLLNVFPLFALGIIYYLYITGVQKVIPCLLCGLLVSALSVYTSGWLATSSGLFALAILAAPLPVNTVVKFLSKISFSLYLTHDIVGSNLVVFMGMHFPKIIVFKGGIFLTGIAVSIAFAFLFYKLIEEPCLKLSKKIHYTVKTIL